MSPLEALRQIGLLIEQERWLQNRGDPGPRQDVLTSIRVSELVRVLDDVDPLDLDDPATENAVADAIARLKGGGFLPLSERYPWRFPQIPPGRCGVPFDAAPDTRYSCELLAGHAGWHQETRFHPEDGAPQVMQWNQVE